LHAELVLVILAVERSIVIVDTDQLPPLNQSVGELLKIEVGSAHDVLEAVIKIVAVDENHHSF
jgi:hypothetical protein